MSRDPDCIFCKIVSVQVPASVVYEDEGVIAFLDIAPLADGHLLVVSREHYSRFSDVPPQKCAKLASVLPMLGRAVMRVTGAEGFNLLMNEGPVAGQAVPHLHFHLIPRTDGDGLGYRWQAGAYEGDRAAELATAYQAALTERP
jgi:histidine triad (HIT) family protein